MGALRQLSVRKFDVHSVPNFSLSGMSEGEYRTFLENFKQKSKEPSFVKCMKGVAGGSVGCSFIPGSYVAYVSKCPISGLFNLHESEEEVLPLKQYLDGYASLLMVLSSYDRVGPDEVSFWGNLGIFKKTGNLTLWGRL